MKYLIPLLLLLFKFECLASTIITECKVEKSAYVNMTSENSLDQDDKTEFTLSDYTGNVREIYTLTRGNMDTSDITAYKLGFYDISYRNLGNSNFNWNLLSHVKSQNGDGRILNHGSPIIIRVYYPGIQEQLYYFNLNTEGTGHMSMSNTRWISIFNLINNQSIVYGTCSKPEKTDNNR